MKLMKPLVFLSLLAFSASSYASLYIGADLKKLSTKYNSENKDHFARITGKAVEAPKAAVGLFFGYEFTENFALEAGFDIWGKSHKVYSNRNGVITDAKYAVGSNKYIDLVGSHALNETFSLVGSLGVGFMKNKIHCTETINGRQVATVDSNKSNHAGIRLGAGVKAKITDELGTRLMVNYQRGHKAFAKRVVGVGVGLTYSFLDI